MARRKIHGFIVMESCDEYEQVLALEEAPGLPTGGVLRWADRYLKRSVFASRKAARAAIVRTEHYRLAYGDSTCAEANLCRVEPVVMVEA